MANNLAIILEPTAKDPSEFGIEDFDKQVWDRTWNGFLIHGIDDQNLIPWDACYEIKDGNLILHGGVDSGGFGKVRIELPMTKAAMYYYLVLEPKTDEDYEYFADIFKRNGYIVGPHTM